MSTDLIALWHERARPQPTEADFNVQLGCHLEEIAEMLECLSVGMNDYSLTAGTNTPAYRALCDLSNALKKGQLIAKITDRKEMLDSLADQVVTAIGVAHCSGLGVVEGVRRVNTSNWSKFVDGRPLRDANGKITKGPQYEPPVLDGLY